MKKLYSKKWRGDGLDHGCPLRIKLKENNMEKTGRSAGRPAEGMKAGVPKGFAREYKKFLDGKYGDITKRQFAKILGIGVSILHRYENCIRSINKQEKKELKVLASDFGLLYREDVQEIIETCKSYEEGQMRMMRVYSAVYMG